MTTRRKLLLHLSALGIALLVALVVRASAFETYRVASSSMTPSLLEGDHVLVNKLLFGGRLPWIGIDFPAIREPRPGDVLLFRHPDALDQIHVKRCAAVSGGIVALQRGSMSVPDDMLFVLGDNAEGSSDSREWGFLPRDLVVGLAARVVWSGSPDGIRWNRLGVRVR